MKKDDQNATKSHPIIWEKNIKKYEKIRLLGEGNYGKAILVKSLIDKVTKLNY